MRDVRFVRFSEVRGVHISEVEMYGVHAVVGRGHAVVGRLSALRSVHYWRFHCILIVPARVRQDAVNE